MTNDISAEPALPHIAEHRIIAPSHAARCFAAGIVVLDVVGIRYPIGMDSSLLALLGMTAVACLGDGRLDSFGMRLHPHQTWWYWCRWALIFGGWIAVALAVFVGLWLLAGWKLPVYATYPSLDALILMCVYSPLCEEVIYRSLLIAAVLPTIGERGSIVLSGVIFSLIHVLRGNASPENQIAGFMLSWAFLKSGTILVPIAMHSGGNFIALASQVIGWYLTRSAPGN